FRDAYGDLRARGVQVVGVSDDDPESHLRFQEAHQLPYPLLTDEGRAMANAFGLRGTLGLWPRRVTFGIDASGIIRGVFHHELSAKKHVDDALAVLNTDATSRA
ncbi:MAG: peroxiredoxin, partial [Myxococcales bacterium]|nr:peroxiredoxin [Myxococcales bacterium]